MGPVEETVDDEASGPARSRVPHRAEESEIGVPEVGQILMRLRKQRRLSLKEVGEASGLSPSFLSAVERGESDIAFKRLARLARVYHHDVGSLLGYSARRVQPQFVTDADRFDIDRGPGVGYTVIRLPGLSFTLFDVSLEPGAATKDELLHEGVDVGIVLEGEIVLVYDRQEHLMKAPDVAVWSGGYPHLVRNDGERRARGLFLTTGSVQ